jgi:hypothetical protein
LAISTQQRYKPNISATFELCTIISATPPSSLTLDMFSPFNICLISAGKRTQNSFIQGTAREASKVKAISGQEVAITKRLGS